MRGERIGGMQKVIESVFTPRVFLPGRPKAAHGMQIAEASTATVYTISKWISSLLSIKA